MNFKLILLFSLDFLLLSAYTFQKNIISDLEYNNASFFSEMSSWTIISTSATSNSSTCNGTRIMGGYGTFYPNDYLIRIYTGLPNHDIIDLTFEAWRIDSVDSVDKFIFYVDGKKFSFTGAQFASRVSICGGSHGDDLILYYYARLFHNGSSLNLTFQNGCNQNPNDESFGYRAIKIRFRNKSANEIEQVYGYGSNPPGPLKMITCSSGQTFSDIFTGCQPCFPGCEWCSGPGIQNCAFCSEETGHNTNATLCSRCNASNLDTCLACKKPYYLNLYNMSCDVDCPYKNITNSTGNFCYFPCLSDEFLYQNGTCLKKCDEFGYGNISYPGAQTCEFKCPSNQFLYRNGSCMSSCSFPFYSTSTATAKYCNFICSNGTFLLNGTCSPNCTLPTYYSITFPYNESYCYKSLITNNQTNTTNTTNTTNLDDALLSTLATVVQVAVIGSFASSAPLILVGVDPSIVASLVAMLQMFYYLLFFNVNYPENVKRILVLFSLGKFDFLPNPLSWVEFDFDPLDSPPNFFNNGYSGLMFQSAGAILFGYALLLAIDFLSLFVARHINFLSLIRKISRFLTDKIKANGYVRLIIATFPDMMFTSLLQLIEINFSTKLYAASSLIAVLVICGNVLFLCLSYRILSRKSTSHNQLEVFEAFFEDFDVSKNYVKIFGFGRILIKAIYCVALVIYYYLPYYQVGIPIILNIVMATLLMKYQPHHHEAKNNQETILEISYLCLHSCILALVIDDEQNKLADTTRENVGWCMIGIIMLNVLISTGGIFVEEYHAIKDFVLDLKETASKIKEYRSNARLKLAKKPAKKNSEQDGETAKNNKAKSSKIAFIQNPLRSSMQTFNIPKNAVNFNLEDDSESDDSDEEELVFHTINFESANKKNKNPRKTPRKLTD